MNLILRILKSIWDAIYKALVYQGYSDAIEEVSDLTLKRKQEIEEQRKRIRAEYKAKKEAAPDDWPDDPPLNGSVYDKKGGGRTLQ